MTPVEIMARAHFQVRWRTDKDWESIQEDKREFHRKRFRESVAALEAAGWRIVHPENVILDTEEATLIVSEALAAEPLYGKGLNDDDR